MFCLTTQRSFSLAGKTLWSGFLLQFACKAMTAKQPKNYHLSITGEWKGFLRVFHEGPNQQNLLIHCITYDSHLSLCLTYLSQLIIICINLAHNISLCLSSKYQSLNTKREEGEYLSDFFLHWGRDGAVLSALCIALTVAALGVSAGDAGSARMTEFLLLISGLVLMFIVKHCFKVHHCPGMPGLPTGENRSQKEDDSLSATCTF